VRGAPVEGIEYSGDVYGTPWLGEAPSILRYISGTVGSFKTGTFSFIATRCGEYEVVVTQTFANNGGSYVSTCPLYITGIDASWAKSTTLRTITGSGLKPLERCTLYVEYLSGDGEVLPGGEMQYKGVAAADKDGLVEFDVDVANGSRYIEIRQSVILADGSGQLTAMSTGRVDFDSNLEA
jgi:hypothetical protein